jgi:FMN-dependent NADH-azoreductase
MSKTLLHIDSSARFADSESRQLSAQFVQQWVANHPEFEVKVRDIVSTPLPHLDEAMLGAMMTPAEGHDGYMAAIAQRIDILVEEFLQADMIVIGAPMYNLGIPSTLKAYIDHIVMVGRTFTYTETGAVGLAKNKPVYIITARGGVHADLPSDQQAPYLKTLFNFLGIDDVHFIHSEGLNMGDEMRDQAIEQARTQINVLVA